MPPRTRHPINNNAMAKDVVQDTEVTLTVVSDESFRYWKGQHSFTTFLDGADKASYSPTSFLRASSASKSFPTAYLSFTVELETVVSQIIELTIKEAFPELDEQLNNSSGYIKADKSISITGNYGEIIQFSLSYPAWSSEALDLSTKLSELGAFGRKGEVVVLKREVSPSLNGSGLNIVRDYTDFQKRVTSWKKMGEINDYLCRQKLYNPSFSVIPLVGTLLYTEEDFELATYVRENFDNLHAMSRKDIEIFFIEEPPSNNFKTVASFWKARLQHAAYLTWSLLGWVRSKPYDKSQAYEIAASLGIYPDRLPCLVIFDEPSCSDKIVVPISGDYSSLFRKAFSDIQYCLDSINKDTKPTEIDDPLEYLEYPLHKRRELFEKLRTAITLNKVSNSSSSDERPQNYLFIERADVVSNNPGGFSQINTGSMSGEMQQASTGRDNEQAMTIEVASDVPTQLEVIEMLANLEEIVRDSALLEAEKDKAKIYLNAAKIAAEGERPDKELIAKNLEGATKVLKATDETVKAGLSLFEKVSPTIKALIPWLGKAAGALLNSF